MLPFNTSESSAPSHLQDNRLVRMSYGAFSPLWLPFFAAAGAGAMVWMTTRWMRGEFAGASARATHPAPSPSEVPTAADLMSAGAIDAPLPSNDTGPSLTVAGLDEAPLIGETAAASNAAAEPDLAPRKIERIENYMAHNPPPSEAGASAPEDSAPPPPVPAEHVLDHTPPETVNAPGNPDVERKIEQAHGSGDPDFLGHEPGGKAGLLAETSASVLSGAANFGGDVRAEETAEASLSPAEEDDLDTLADAAYAENLGPVPTAAAPSGRSKKSRVRPGTAPGA